MNKSVSIKSPQICLPCGLLECHPLPLNLTRPEKWFPVNMRRTKGKIKRTRKKTERKLDLETIYNLSRISRLFLRRLTTIHERDWDRRYSVLTLLRNNNPSSAFSPYKWAFKRKVLRQHYYQNIRRDSISSLVPFTWKTFVISLLFYLSSFAVEVVVVKASDIPWGKPKCLYKDYIS